MTISPQRVVVIGYGPVGARLVEGLLGPVADKRMTLTVVGAERSDAYNRVLLAEYAVGRSARHRLDTTDTAAARMAGAHIRLGEAAVRIDRRRQLVHLDSGDELPYDQLVFATGARANIPTIDGLQRSRRDKFSAPTSAARLDEGAKPLPHGVIALRDLHDAAVLLKAVSQKQRLVVLGAGVLGMELALAAAEQGAKVVAVYHGDIPMARNLDRGAGRVLAAAARGAGVSMASHSRAESILFRYDTEGEQVFDALVCADGKQIPGDLLVLSCGVSARTELAAAAGLTVSAGIVVDEKLQAWNDPAVFAIGDCAHIVAQNTHSGGQRISGAPSGLIGPGWKQADWLAIQLGRMLDDGASTITPDPGTGTPMPPERQHVVMLKAEGIDVVSGGDHSPELWDEGHEVTQWADPARGSCVKMVTQNGVLTGFVSAGMPRLGAELTLLFESSGELPRDRSSLLQLDSTAGGEVSTTDPFAPGATVCWCNGVTASTIMHAVAAGQNSVDFVGKATRAGTGCGGCKGRIAEIIARTSAEIPTSRLVSSLETNEDCSLAESSVPTSADAESQQETPGDEPSFTSPRYENVDHKHPTSTDVTASSNRPTRMTIVATSQRR
ncbi:MULTISPECIES: FAD-dependent oxidoreductase [Subtercola]|uniref:FAD-dependent oxidoreductase n=1 Tax=Subtercola TaxID=120212 RepID=UPI001F3D880C|nr:MULTISPECIES: FAD-dependent oxidoreductase [Subtercola]MEA9984293.1 FAD-dependent oxidoreductase [Subtercola sp. RTI3]